MTVVSFEADWEKNVDVEAAPFEVVPLRWTQLPSSRRRYWGTRFGVLPPRSPASDENVARIRDLLDTRAIDVVVAETVHLAPLLPVVADRPLVWVEEGIFSTLHHPSQEPRTNLYRRAQAWVAYLRWRDLERWVWQRANVLIGVSDAEAAEIRERVRGKVPVVVVPNGVDCDHFGRVHPALGSHRGLFVGSRWRPNVEALHFFADQVLPRILRALPDFQLVVVGDVSESRMLRQNLPKEIELVGFVDDLRSVFAASGVFVAPILRGHGTRIKLLEAMAAGVPIVSTRKGAEGLALVDGQNVLLADDATAFADAVVELIREPERAARLAASALGLARESHDWTIAAKRLEDALRLAVEASERASAEEKEVGGQSLGAGPECSLMPAPDLPAPQAAIIVPTFNRRESLRRLLESLHRQTLPAERFEILVVDNNSTDGTAEEVCEFAARRTLRLRYVAEPAQGTSHARNRGIRETSSPIVAFIDDDVEADSSWLQEILNGLEKWQPAAVGGRTEPFWDGSLPDWWLPEYHKVFARNWGDTPRPVTSFPFFYGQNFAARRETLAAVGGFDPRFGPKAAKYVAGEDADLCRRIHESGRVLYYLPRAVVRHHVGRDRLTRAFLRRRFRASGVTHAWQRRIEARPLEMPYQLKQIAIGFAQWALCRPSSAERFRRELDLWYRAGFLRASIGLIS